MPKSIFNPSRRGRRYSPALCSLPWPRRTASPCRPCGAGLKRSGRLMPPVIQHRVLLPHNWRPAQG